MFQLVFLYIWLPLAGFLVSLPFGRKQESLISGIAIATTGIHLAGVSLLTGWWVFNSMPTLDEHHILLYDVDHVRIAIGFYFDRYTAVFACVGSLLTFLVFTYSRYFIHRDGGFKRFFNNTLLFFLGYNLVIFSGNFETLFVGWEFLGVCTFLLVSFYRERYLPVRNSLKVISFYRFGDVCLILAMWMSHHVWHGNVVFSKLAEPGLVAGMISQNYWEFVFIALMIFIGAAVKSAQLPFSTWLPRAMEGPTPSSAIFYGSLSVHLGVFLLLRTYPYWDQLLVIKVLVVCTGLLTSLVATGIAKVQSSAKPQIAYSSIAQIGLMFVEVGMGWHVLALVHFTGNALLRTYQLLVSPTLQHYLIHDMFFNFKPGEPTKTSASSKLKNSLYMLSLKEWNLDFILRQYFWHPFKRIGNLAGFMTGKLAVVVLASLFAAGLYAWGFVGSLPAGMSGALRFVYSLIALVLILNAFSSRGDASGAWRSVAAGQLFITLAIAMQNDVYDLSKMLLYLGGCIVAAVAGYMVLRKVKAADGDIQLERYHGYSYELPAAGLAFLVCCLALVGIPFTPVFIGIDVLFSNIQKDNVLLVTLSALCFLFMELAILRIYVRIFMGLHKKNNHAMVFKSS